MAILIILIGYYLDYKTDPKTFLSDLKKGLLFLVIFIFYNLTLKFVFDLNWLYIIFMIGIEIIVLFSIKALIQNNNN